MRADMRKEKYPIPEQDPKERIQNFREVTLGYTQETAMQEAMRCLECKHKPCMKGCPVNVDIPGFIREIKEGRFREAFEIIYDTNSLPAICGRVCPQETQCEQYCIRGVKGESVGIGRLERFAADFMMDTNTGFQPANKNGRSVAVVGAGPAGLTCAGDLIKLGYSVTVYEAFHEPGGVLVYGIPEFRLPKDLVKKEIGKLEAAGVKIRPNMVIGKVLNMEELLEEHDAVFIGTGAGLPKFMGIPGENFVGVYSANEFLTRVNLMKAYRFPEYDTPVRIGRDVTVVGGGNVAMDSARSARRLGSRNVTVVYRRGEQELPARREEVHHAKEEGIEFRFLENPIRILGDQEGNVTGMECICMELGEPDDSGRQRPIPRRGSEHVIPTDMVIMAIGQSPNPLIAAATPALKTHSWGGIVTEAETGRTSMPRVYAGGDIVTGAATVILAMGAGKNAAQTIHEDLKKE